MRLSDDAGTIALVATIVWVVALAGLYVWWGWALARLFSILGAPKWRAWVPVVNTAEIFRLGGYPSWYVILGFIPIANIYGLVVYVQALHAITVQMGRGPGMTTLGVFLAPLWATMLGSEGGASQSRYAVHPEAIAASADPARAHAGLTPPTPVSGLSRTDDVDQPWPLESSAPDGVVEKSPQAPFGAPYAVRPFASTPQIAVESDPYEVWSEPRKPEVSSQEPFEAHAAMADADERRSVLPETASPVDMADDPIEFPEVTEHTPVPPLPLSPVGLPSLEDLTPPPTPAFLNAPSAEPEPESAPAAPLWEPEPATSAWPQPVLAPQAPVVDHAPESAEGRAAPAAPLAPEPTFAVVDISSFEDEDEDGMTIMVDRRPIVRWQLTLDSGAAFPITHSTVIVGRKPTSLEGTVQALALPDLTKTLSKVHARLELINDEWFITDLHSTNGVILTAPSGEEVAVAEGDRAKVSGRFVLGKVGMTLAVAP